MTEAPEFFVPLARNAEEAEQVWGAVKAFMLTIGWDRVTDRRIFRLGYLHDGKHMEAEVGSVHPYGGPVDWEEGHEPRGEEVFVILERDGGPFLVCTPNRGVARGDPILVGSGEPYETIYFAGYGPEDV
jgi:hypothetical protein